MINLSNKIKLNNYEINRKKINKLDKKRIK